MSVLSEGFAGWFRPKHSTLASDEEQNAATATTGGSIDQEPVVVWMAANQMEAEIVKARLESGAIHGN